MDGEELKIPLDLSEWSAPGDLFAWVQAEVESLDWSNPELAAYLLKNPGYQPKPMLCLLTFAYATGNFESEEIVRLSHTDEYFRALSPLPAPSPAELGRFRRDHRGLLKALLAQLFRRVLKEKLSMDDLLLPAGIRRLLVETADVRLDIARHVDRLG